MIMILGNKTHPGSGLVLFAQHLQLFSDQGCHEGPGTRGPEIPSSYRGLDHLGLFACSQTPRSVLPEDLPEAIRLPRAHLSFESHSFVAFVCVLSFSYLSVFHLHLCTLQSCDLFVAIHTGPLVYSSELLNHFFQSLE